VSEATREELRRFQQILELGDEEVAQLEEKVTSQNERGQNQSQQADILQTPEVGVQEAQNSKASQEYEIEVAKYINIGISLKDYVIRKRLYALQNTLGISDAQAEAIELRLSENNQATKSSVNVESSVKTDSLYQQKRQQYEQEIAKKISSGISLNDFYIRSQLKQIQNRLQLTDADVSQIEQQVLSQRRSESSQDSTASPPPGHPQYHRQYRRDSIVSKIPQANPAKTPDNSQPNFSNPPQRFLESVNSPPELGETTQQRFWLMWTLAYTFGSGFGWFASNLLFSNLDPSNTFFNLIKGSMVGFTLGGAQWFLLRHVSHRMKLWILLTTVGYATSYAMSTTFWGKLYGGSVPLVLIESLYGLVTGSLIGLAQWFVLQPLVQQSKIWFLSVLIAETLGGSVGWGIFGAIYQISSPSETLNFALMGLTSGGVSGVLSGLITGRVMLRLLRLKKSPPIA